jgi:hypothetical protein
VLPSGNSPSARELVRSFTNAEWIGPRIYLDVSWRDVNGGVQFITRFATALGRSGALCPPNLAVASPRLRTQMICRRDWVCSAPQVGVPETGCPRQSYGLRIERFLNWMARAGSHDPWGLHWFVIRERCEAPRT